MKPELYDWQGGDIYTTVRNYLNYLPCRDLNPGPHRQQAAELTIEL